MHITMLLFLKIVGLTFEWMHLCFFYGVKFFISRLLRALHFIPLDTLFRSMTMVEDESVLRAMEGSSFPSPGIVFRSMVMVEDGTLLHAMAIGTFGVVMACVGFITTM